MNRKSVILIGLAVLLAAIIPGCGSAPTAPQLAAPAPKNEATAPVAEAWQQKWDKLVADAKKEGQVVIASSIGAPAREAFSKGFTGKHGITLEFMSAKPVEMVAKIQAERRAGLFLVDMFIAGPGTVVPELGPEGALEKLDGALLLPEVVDKKAWWGGDLLWQDPDHFQLMFLAFPNVPLTVNTSLVKPGEVRSYRDLLDPRWKDKIVFLDPTMGGSGNRIFTMAEYGLIDMDYLRELGKQVAVVSRDERLLIEWVARGKYPIGAGIKPELQEEFKKLGAPVETITPIEGTYISGAGGGLAFLTKAPHPNAAKLFINWLLSREGQVIASQVYGGQSGREDVPTDFLDPVKVRQPGVKYVSVIGEEHMAIQLKYYKIAKEMWGHLIK